MQAAISGTIARLSWSASQLMEQARQVASRVLPERVAVGLETDPRIVNRLATAAVTGLGLLGLATTGVWMAGRFMHADPSLLAVEISVLSRQRILVTRVTTLAEQIAQGPTDLSVRDEIAACTKRLMGAHIALLARSKAELHAVAEQPIACTSVESGWLVTDGRVSARSAALMQSGPSSLDAVMRRFTSAALVVSTLTAQDAALAARLDELTRIGTTVLPERIDALMQSLRRDAEFKGQRWHNAADMALALFYFGLIVFWARLFQPTAQAATKAFRQLADTNAILADRRKALEEANVRLSETAARFRSLSDLSADWYWRMDRDLRFCEVSDGIGRCGLTPDQMIGQRLDDLIDPESASVSEAGEIVAAHKSFRSFEFRLSPERTGACDRWLLVSGEPILAADGTFIGYRGVGRDVSRRRRATEALAESTAKLEALIEAAPIAIAMFDREMRYITCTQRWIADYGLAGQELIGRSHYDVFPDLAESVKESHRRCLVGAIERVPEERLVAPSGREMIVRREIRPWHDSSGQIGGIIILNDDMTAIATAIRSLRKSQERFRLLFDIAPVGLCLADAADGRILMASRALSSMTGHSQAELKCLPLTALAHGLPQPPDPASAEHAPVTAVEVMVQHNDGTEVAAIYSELSFLDEHSRPLRLAAIQDISWRREQEQGLWRAAHIDPLTGLPNRLLLTDHLTRLMEAPSVDGRHLAVCVLDIDDFKATNDTLGQTGGDDLLRIIANRLSEQLDAKDMVARLGGDEFALVLTDVADQEALTQTIVRIRIALSEPMTIDGAPCACSVAIGSAIAVQDGTTADALLNSADIAVNHAKSRGRASYAPFQTQFREQMQKRVRVRADILGALDRHEMVLFYQPITSTSGGRHVGFEALIRWQHPTHGIISPGAFIEAFEDTRTAAAIGRFVTDCAFSQMAAWRKAGLGFGKVSINLATADFRTGNIVERLVEASQRYQVPPAEIGLEITENIFLGAGSEDIERDLGALRSHGFEIAFDDFGTGFASLTHVRRFPIDRIKIDRSFITSLATNESDRAIVCAMIGMAHGLGLRVTAEGVDKESTLDLLGRLGCHEVQGYLLSKPMPASEVPVYLATVTASRSAAGPRGSLDLRSSP